MDGVLIVNKEKGWTSHDVCAKLRGVLGLKRIGHTGTLDPDATGVLPVLLGKATKLSDVLTAEDKVYEAVLRLGIKTTTLDMSGEVVAENSVLDVSEAQIREVISSFIGEIEQVPPMYSAIKVDGKKLYELAREGKEIERKTRKVTISEIEIIDIDVPLVAIRVSCSKGTYIRTLCDDIGEKLGTHAAMQDLRRVRTGSFGIEDALTISEIENSLTLGETRAIQANVSAEETRPASTESPAEIEIPAGLATKILSIENVLSYMPKFFVDEEHRKALLNGNILETSWGEGEISADGTLVYAGPAAETNPTAQLIGIYKLTKDKKLKPYKMLL